MSREGGYSPTLEPAAGACLELDTRVHQQLFRNDWHLASWSGARESIREFLFSLGLGAVADRRTMRPFTTMPL